MAENSKIAWTDHTFNPWIGCTKVSAGCEHCYAESLMDHRYKKVSWGKGSPRQLTKTWGDPVRWNKAAQAGGRRFKVFCASLADVFDQEVQADWRASLFGLIQNTPHLDWLLLTKRPDHFGQFMRDKFPKGLPNVWPGTTIENNDTRYRGSQLLEIPGPVHWLSIEPQLGQVDLGDLLGRWDIYDPALGFIDWVITGGESGHGARLYDLAWARSLRDQCHKFGVAFFMKQLGENWTPGPGKRVITPGDKWDDPEKWPEDLRIREFPKVRV